MDKFCTTCARTLPSTEFYRTEASKDKLSWKCKECARAYSKYHRITFDARRRAVKYNTTENKIVELLSKEVCEICGTSTSWRSHAIDHDHVSGKIRGLLCDKCNKGLGQFLDNPELLRKAALYLERFQ